jgi:predicted nucleic acid-binding protein
VIAVDTSVLVRYLTDDPPEMARRARTLLDADERHGIPIVVLLETAHVLRTQYDVPRPDILDVLLAFVPRVDVETLGLAKDAVIEALARARTLPGIPLADALVVATARAAGAEALLSFDRGIAGHGLRVIEP